LVAYLANRADDIAKKLGGNINSGFGNQVKSDITKLWNKTYATAKEWTGIIRGGGKK